jgi:hypothetical protein
MILVPDSSARQAPPCPSFFAIQHPLVSYPTGVLPRQVEDVAQVEALALADVRRSACLLRCGEIYLFVADVKRSACLLLM